MSPAQIVALREEGIKALATAAGRRPGRVVPLPGGLPAVHELVQRHQRDPAWQKLLAAVAYTESEGDDHAVSTTGAAGPLQLTLGHYGPRSRYGEVNPFVWVSALRRAHAVLDDDWGRAARGEGSVGIEPLAMALAAYKEGWRGAQRPKTAARGRAYAVTVIGHYQQLGGRL